MVLRARQLKTLRAPEKSVIDFKNSKTYSDGCPYLGLFIHTTFRRFLADETIPLKCGSMYRRFLFIHTSLYANSLKTQKTLSHALSLPILDK